jgi:hypothetical protein
VTGRRGRRRKQLLKDIKETRRYWRLEGEVLDRSWWRIHFGRGCGPVVRQTTGLMNTYVSVYKMPYFIVMLCSRVSYRRVLGTKINVTVSVFSLSPFFRLEIFPQNRA